MNTRFRFEFRKFSGGEGEAPLTVVAWASVVTTPEGESINDYDEHIIEFIELEKAFADFALTGGMQRGGEMHERIGGADIIGQITLSNDERIALGFGPGVEGAIVKFRVHEPILKGRIKSGELCEISIAGSGLATPVGDSDA